MNSSSPSFAGLFSHATALHEAGNLAAAEALYQQLLSAYPQKAELLNVLGTLRFQQGRVEEGLRLMEQAIAAQPTYVNAHYDRGVALLSLGRYRDALAGFDHAIALAPTYAEAQWNKSLIKLLLGEYHEGWALYEWRWKRQGQGIFRTFSKPLWLGKESLAGKTILLHAEQGFGDTIQFCRYIPMLKQAGRILFECDKAIAPLMRYNFPDVEVICDGRVAEYDYHTPLMSLPLAFATTLETIPPAPYLNAPPQYIEKWRALLADMPPLCVGLCWAGGQRPDSVDCMRVDARRSLHFSQIKPLLDVANISFVSLQLGPAKAQRDDERVKDIASGLTDWADTAAAISLLGLVVSVDTAVCHLSAAMGKQTFLLNRYDTCWRWLLERDDSPWYPSLTQFRQTTPGDWDSVMARVRAALECHPALVAGSPSGARDPAINAG